MSAPQTETVWGTAGGTTLTVIGAIIEGLPLANVVASAIIGTIVSFFVMEGLKWIKSKITNKDGKIK
jgi:predicted membrane protein